MGFYIPCGCFSVYSINSICWEQVLVSSNVTAFKIWKNQWLGEILGPLPRHELMTIFSHQIPQWFGGKTLPETDSSSLKIGRVPKGKDRLPSIHFQVRALSFRQGIPKQNVWKPFFSFSRILSVGWNFKKRKVINSLVLNCHEFLRWSKLVHNDFLFFLVARKPKMGERSYHS